MTNVRHVLGISGGKDSSALAIYLRNNYPDLNLEYYFSDTGKELDETYEFIENLKVYLGKDIEEIRAIDEGPVDPFDYYLDWMYNGFLPSPKARWCTRHLKLEPFERFVKDDPVVSYVAIRGDEDREGYVSHKPNIQTIFPFRKNIWSEDVIAKVLQSENIFIISDLYKRFADTDRRETILKLLKRPLLWDFDRTQKLNALLDLGVSTFNYVVFEFLKTTDYPLGKVDHFPLLDNEESLGRDDIFRLLENSGVGKPKYYTELPLSVNDQKGTYFRSRSGCYFCFFQQKIEWIWLHEQHSGLFEEAKKYEKDGYTWNEGETLEELVKPERMQKIKEEYLTKMARSRKFKTSKKLVDILLDETEGDGCIACFV
ncbi:MAG: phosphoadenosine phosphosulfate reductase family protein [bacterium]|nr:phosphoadenosine phosphosulfate reductase family protein [bacterium]